MVFTEYEHQYCHSKLRKDAGHEAVIFHSSNHIPTTEHTHFVRTLWTALKSLFSLRRLTIDDVTRCYHKNKWKPTKSRN